jgi:hypothetical protein
MKVKVQKFELNLIFPVVRVNTEAVGLIQELTYISVNNLLKKRT